MAQETQHNFDFETAAASDRLSNRVLQWLARSYETLLEWRQLATAAYIAANGDHALARNRVAFDVRAHFLEGDLLPADLEKWRPGFDDLQNFRMDPPKVSPSNAAYVDWIRIADYLLLSAASPIDIIDRANQQRETEYQSAISSYRIRRIVFETAATLRSDPELPDERLLSRIQKDHPDASMANIKEGRRVAKDGHPITAPKEPGAASAIGPYRPLYF